MIRVYVQIDEAYRGAADEDDLKSVVLRTLHMEGVKEGELSLVITDTETVRGLNRTYRGVDAATDVLSFPLSTGDGFWPSEGSPYLGDVIVAFPVVEDQAARYGHSTQEELRLLAVHGTLHLLGYDHVTPDEEAEMWRKQKAVLGTSYVGKGGQRRSPGGG